MCIAKVYFCSSNQFQMYFSLLFGTRVYLRIYYLSLWSNCFLNMKIEFSLPLEFSFLPIFFVMSQGRSFKVIQEYFHGYRLYFNRLENNRNKLDDNSLRTARSSFHVTWFFLYFQALAVCFLVRVEYGSARSPVTLQSHYRVKDGTCGGGNLLKIHIDSQCRASNGLCGVRCNGASTQDARTSKNGLSAPLI